MILSKQKQYVEAESLFEESFEHFQLADSWVLGDARYRIARAENRLNLALLFTETERRREAIDCFSETISQLTVLVEEFPNSRWPKELLRQAQNGLKESNSQVNAR